jgi:hypothetical protein
MECYAHAVSIKKELILEEVIWMYIRVFNLDIIYNCEGGSYRRSENLYISPNVIRAIKSRMMSWTMYGARMGKTR